MKTNRREFLKRTSKILPILILPSIIRCTTKDNIVQNCNGGCTNSCAYRCNGTCAVECGGTCLNTCRYSGKCDHCSDICKGSCVMTCYGSCQSTSKGKDTIQFKW